MLCTTCYGTGSTDGKHLDCANCNAAEIKAKGGVVPVDPAEIADVIRVLVSALQMAKHIVANEGTKEQADKVFDAIEKATGEPA